MSGIEVVMVTALGETKTVEPLAGSAVTSSFALATGIAIRINVARTPTSCFNFMI
jgi:hypothetical protein